MSLPPSQAVIYDVYILDTIFSFLSSADIVSVGRTCRTALDAKRSYLSRAQDDERRISLFFPDRTAFSEVKKKLNVSIKRPASFDDAYRSSTFKLELERRRLRELGAFLEDIGYTLRENQKWEVADVKPHLRRAGLPLSWATESLDGLPPRASACPVYYDKVANGETLTVAVEGFSMELVRLIPLCYAPMMPTRPDSLRL